MKQYYPSLDGLRSIAVGIVLLAHAGFPYPKSGGVGVDIFFVLSGFLITSILSHESQATGCISRKNFYVRRLLRLTPCLVVTIILFSIIFTMKHGSFPTDIVLISITYTANWARALFDYELGSMSHCWSLAIEEQYYLIWPFIIIFLDKSSTNEKKKFLFLLAIGLSLAVYRSVFAFSGTFNMGRIYFGLDTHMDGLVIGSSLSYLVMFVRKSTHDFSRVFMFLSRILLPGAILGLLVLMYLITWMNPWMGKLGFLLVALATSVIILDLVLSPKSLIRGILSNSILVYIGRISYGLYLLHFPLYNLVDFIAPEIDFSAKATLKLLLSQIYVSSDGGWPKGKHGRNLLRSGISSLERTGQA